MRDFKKSIKLLAMAKQLQTLSIDVECARYLSPPAEMAKALSPLVKDLCQKHPGVDVVKEMIQFSRNTSDSSLSSQLERDQRVWRERRWARYEKQTKDILVTLIQ